MSQIFPHSAAHDARAMQNKGAILIRIASALKSASREKETLMPISKVLLALADCV